MEITQQPRLLRHIPTSLPQLLNAALDSHRYVLNLKQDDADALLYVPTPHRFSLAAAAANAGSNAAQVLTSLAETLVEGPAALLSSQGREDAVPLLQEAVETFEKCFNAQQLRLREAGTQPLSDNPALGNSDPPSSPQPRSLTGSPPSTPSEAEEQERWASILEPLTPSTVLETCLAEAHALATLLPLLPSDANTYQILQAHTQTLLSKADSILSSIQSPDPAASSSPHLESPNSLAVELAQSRLNLLSSLADLAFRSFQLSAQDYLSAVTQAFSSSQPSLASHGPSQADYADALIACNSSLASTSLSLTADSNSDALSLRWTSLTRALSALGAANASPGTASRAGINGRRGDAEMLRVRLADAGHEAAIKNQEQLLRNAETYYEGARKIAAAAAVAGTGGADSEAKAEGGWKIRKEVARVLREGGMEGVEQMLSGLSGGERDSAVNVLEEMREEELLPVR